MVERDNYCFGASGHPSDTEYHSELEVIAISVGKPKWNSMKGHEVRSAIVRDPSTQAINVTPHGIEGHESAAHNAQVCSLFAHHYDHWTQKLGIPRSEWDWCHWGENLTLRTSPELDETQVHIGDLWQIGGGDNTVLLEVYGGRVPCSRLAWRCGQKESWLKQVAASGRCGVYLRVLRGGTILKGDRGAIVKRCPSAVSVANIAQMAFADDSLAARQTINLLLQESKLQEMNRTYLLRKLNLLRDSELKGRDGWKGWRPFRVSSSRDERGDAKSFYIKPVDGQDLAAFIPGQFLTVRLPTGITRCWSISDWTGDEIPSYYRLTIKKRTTASKWLLQASITDLILEARCPSGSFNMDRDSLFAPRQIYISAGIGITPICTMIKGHIHHDGLMRAPAIWIHVTRNSSTFVLCDDLPTPLDFVRKIVFFTSPLSGKDVLGQDFDMQGRPSLSFFQNLLQEPYFLDPMNIKPIQMDGHLSACYICGPQEFERETRSFLKDCHVPEPLVHSESFSNQPYASSLPDIEEATIHFTKSNKKSRWRRSEPLSLLEVAEKAGLEPEHGCRSGSCGSCSAALVGGSVVGGLQPGGTTIYMCTARPATAVVEISL